MTSFTRIGLGGKGRDWTGLDLYSTSTYCGTAVSSHCGKKGSAARGMAMQELAMQLEEKRAGVQEGSMCVARAWIMFGWLF